MFDLRKRSGVVVGAVLGVAATLGVHALLTPAHAAPAAVSTVGMLQIGYAGQLDSSLTGKYPVVLRLYGNHDSVLHEETVTVEVQRGKFRATAGRQTDLRTVLRDAQTMRVFFQGTVIDTLAVLHATPDEARANPAQFTGPHKIVARRGVHNPPPDPPDPGPDPTPAPATCSASTTTQVLGAGAWSISPPACASGLTMVSAGILPFANAPTYTFEGMFPSSAVSPDNPQNDWSLMFSLTATATIEVAGLCCP